MAVNQKQLARLKKAQRRREARPATTHVAPVKLKASRGLESRMARDHIDLLQNIEFGLSNEYADEDDVDDFVVSKALKAAILGGQPEDSLAQQVHAVLLDIREMRNDADDETWSNALRVVYTSVRRHSNCRRGSIDYLTFISKYVK